MAVALTATNDGINRLPVAAPQNVAANERRANAARYLRATASALRPGVLPGPGTWVLSFGSPTADTWYITAGSAVLADGAAGGLEVTSGSTKSESVTRPGSGTTRYDVIALEPVFTGSPAVSIVRYSGTASASPSIATALSQISANGLLLGSYQIGNTGAPTIATTPAQRTVTVGSTLPLASAAERTALDGGGLYKGIRIFREDLGIEQINPNGVAEATTAGSWVNVPTAAQVNAPHWRGWLASAAGIVANTDIAFTTLVDTDSAWSGTVFTAKRAGVYRFKINLQAGGSGGGASQNVKVFKGGSDAGTLWASSVTVANFQTIGGDIEMSMALNDTVTFRCTSAFTSGSNAAATPISYASIDWLRP